jgi:NAD(P)-dependent dehydrogenase (short-subunit alcohol dehydrogenase family)
MHQDWKTQHIVVTGAASGLGRAVCVRLVQLGANVHGIDINKAALEEMRAVLGERFIPVICDVTNWLKLSNDFHQLMCW